MSDADLDAVVAALVEARQRAAAVALPGDWSTVDLTTAYRMQRDVASRLGAVGGWKISAVTEAQQQAAGVPGPVAAPLLEPWFKASGASYSRAAFCAAPLLECEYAFMLGADLPARETPYTRAEVEAAIAAVHIVLEVCDSRLAGSGSTLQQLADDFNNGAFVLGPAQTAWRGIDYAGIEIVLRAGGDADARTSAGPLAVGSGQAVLEGDPVSAVVLMANLRPRLAGGLRAGQVITTGSYTKPYAVTADGEFIGDFGALGTVRVRFDANAPEGAGQEQPQ